jgi:hypothetical protein
MFPELPRPKSPYSFSVFGLRKKAVADVVDPKTKAVIISGEPAIVLLGGGENKKLTETYMANVKANTNGHWWTIWMEEKSA